METESLQELEESIGYLFTNQEWLEQAVTHSSYAHERKINKCEDNERLEFLGDAVLELTVSEWLFARQPHMAEGEMTKTRAGIVCEPTLATCAREIALGKYLLLSKGEQISGGRDRDSLLSDAFEAVIGAIYQDGGLEPAKRFISQRLLQDIEHKCMFRDSKTMLQEYVQEHFEERLSYHILSELGPDHNKCFRVIARVGLRDLMTGEGKTKKKAEQDAAKLSLELLKGITK